MPDDLRVHAGEPIRVRTWAAMEALLASLQLLKGNGIRLARTPAGTVVTAAAPPQPWLHPFRVSLIGSTAAQLRPGLVSGIMPKIGITALDADSAPLLRFDAPLLDADGRGWIALEVTLGKLWEVATAQVVQVADLDTDDGDVPPSVRQSNNPSAAVPGYTAGASLTLSGRRARHPLAMLRQRRGGSLSALQVTHFNLAHRVFLAAAGAERGRHFFFPA